MGTTIRDFLIEHAANAVVVVVVMAMIAIIAEVFRATWRTLHPICRACESADRVSIDAQRGPTCDEHGTVREVAP